MYLCSNVRSQAIFSQRNINCNLKHTVPVRLVVVSYLQPARCQYQMLLVFSSTTQKNSQKRSLAFSSEIIANFLYLFSPINQFTVILCYYGNGSVLSEPFSFNMKKGLLIWYHLKQWECSQKWNKFWLQVPILQVPRTWFFCLLLSIFPVGQTPLSRVC